MPIDQLSWILTRIWTSCDGNGLSPAFWTVSQRLSINLLNKISTLRNTSDFALTQFKYKIKFHDYWIIYTRRILKRQCLKPYRVFTFNFQSIKVRLTISVAPGVNLIKIMMIIFAYITNQFVVKTKKLFWIQMNQFSSGLWKFELFL